MWLSAITLCLSDFIMFEKFMISFIAWFIIIESTKKKKEKKWTFASECFKGCLWNYAYNCMGRAAFEELAWVGREQSGEGGREGWLIWIAERWGTLGFWENYAIQVYMLLILKSGCHHYVVYSQIIEFLFQSCFLAISSCLRLHYSVTNFHVSFIVIVYFIFHKPSYWSGCGLSFPLLVSLYEHSNSIPNKWQWTEIDVIM